MRFRNLLLPALLLTSACNDDKEGASSNAKNEKGESSTSVTPSDREQEPAATKLDRKLLTSEISLAKETISSLVRACHEFYAEYSTFPMEESTGKDTTRPTSGETGMKFTAALIGLESANEDNFKQISFFTANKAKDKKGGLHRTQDTGEIFDPWGNPYYVHLNYDFDDELKEPSSDEIHYDTKVLVWSPGPDGKTGTPETNEDNICSWK